jgi:hypothetical protein
LDLFEPIVRQDAPIFLLCWKMIFRLALIS